MDLFLIGIVTVANGGQANVSEQLLAIAVRIVWTFVILAISSYAFLGAFKMKRFEDDAMAQRAAILA